MSALGENISNYLIKHFGEEYAKRYEEYIFSTPSYFIRINRNCDESSLIEELKSYGIKLSAVENVDYAYLIEEGMDKVGKTLQYILGKYYIQSLSSMIPPIVLDPKEDDLTLDLCAAPGSKTTELSEIMKNRGTLYANEISIQRLRSLVHNLDKINATNVGVLNFKGELLSKIYDSYFDKILVDAPCSALGIIQKKEEVTNWWNKNQMEKIANLQLRLLISAIKMAKVGGEIVYSTCTLTLEENELVLQTVLKKYPVELAEVELPVPSHPAFTKYGDENLNPEIAKARRIIPWEINSEGFFVAKLIKTAETEGKEREVPLKRKEKLLSFKDKNVAKYLNDIAEHFGFEKDVLNQFNYLLKKKDIFFINKDWYAETLAPFNRVGTKFGNIDKRTIAHLHTQAAQSLGKFATKNVFEFESFEELRTYLDGGTIKSVKLEPGQKIVRFGNYFLGTAISTGEGLKSQFPRSHRTGKIILQNEV